MAPVRTVVLVLVAFLFAGELSSRPESPGGAPLAFASSAAPSDAQSDTSALGYGFGAQINQPFHEVGSEASASVFFFNLSRQDAFGLWVPFGGEGCSFFVNILDDKGRLVRRPRVPCPLLDVGQAMPIGPFPLPAGTFRRVDVLLPLAYASSETGDPDGTPLPGGLYTLQALQLFSGPGPGEPSLLFGGGDPEARVPFRIHQCTPSTGPLPIRELARGSFSGYRYSDPNFVGEDLLLRTAAAGLQFWRQHTGLISPPPGPPAVDLTREMVLVSLAGYRPSGGSVISITAVEEKACHLEVTVWETVAPVAIAAVTNPFHIVAVPRRLKEVRFVHAVALPDPPLSGMPCGGGAGACP